MAVVNASRGAKTVADPNAKYESLMRDWLVSRAMCSGEQFVKAYDSVIDNVSFNNLLIPFSPSMSSLQYNFYRAEAELPGITAEFSKMIVSGLLRKPPTITLPPSVPKEAADWIKYTFNQDNTSIESFLGTGLWEEIQTSRAWVYVDYPHVINPEDLTPDEKKELKPYPVLWPTETVINWKMGFDDLGKQVLKQVIVRGFTEEYGDNEFHPSNIETIKVHELDEKGEYRIRVFKAKADVGDLKFVNGQQVKDMKTKPAFEHVETLDKILVNSERLKFIPAWPLNGQVEPSPPMLNAVINKEIALYNKISRRNHLLYGAATYTPVIIADMSDEDFEEIVNSGLGTWIKLPAGSSAEILQTPTEALADMDRAIMSSIEEMAKLGIRMLTPEADQSGIALEIRNAAQTARLGTLSSKVSSVMQQIIAFMLEWRYGIVVKASEVVFKLSEDFNATPFGADWMRLATEWYQQGLIPRSIWVQMLKQNDMLPSDYDDKEGQKEIDEEQLIDRQAENDDFADRAKLEYKLLEEAPEVAFEKRKEVPVSNKKKQADS
jgi:hypothetical protein